MVEHSQGEVRNAWLFLRVGSQHQGEAPSCLNLELERGREFAVLLLEKGGVRRSNDRERVADNKGYTEQSSNYHEKNREHQNNGETRHRCPQFCVLAQ